MKDQVVLVNERDEAIGIAGKMEAHEMGLLHRAFSVFIFNRDGEMLLQQRAAGKYHSGGLWTNACCSHPGPGEETLAAAQRRLREELGFETPVRKIFDFIYKTGFANGLTEYEFDHVFAGEYEGSIPFNTAEVNDVRYATMQEIGDSLTTDPEEYTEWFRLAFPRIREWVASDYKSSNGS